MDYQRKIDHTLLKPEATEAQVRQLVKEALDYHFYSCCVNTKFVDLVHELVKGSDVATCCVVGFPLGAMSKEAKEAETRYAVEHGADEVDMVISIADIKEGKDDAVEEEIRSLKQIVGPNRVLKVIIETCLLTDDEKRRACVAAANAGADFVKTSTGFSTGGATVEDVRLMKESVQGRCLVKASGGIRTKDDFLAMVEAGADRIGASAGIAIMEALQ